MKPGAHHRTVHLVKSLRRMGAAAKRTRVPRQIPPARIEEEYGRKLSTFVVSRVHAALQPLMAELPALMASAASNLRTDGLAQDAGEGKRVRQLIDDARAHMQRTIMTSKLEELSSMYASNTAAYQKQQLDRQARAALGVNPFLSDRKLQPLTEGFVNANVGHVKGLVDDVASRLERKTLTALQDGMLYPDFAKQLESSFGFADSRAKLIARDQTGKLYGQINAARQKELGVTSFIWRTSEDDRVREEHVELDGQTFDYDNPPDEGLPGEPIQCRCTAEPDFSAILDDADTEQQPGESDQEPEQQREPEVPDVREAAPDVVDPVAAQMQAARDLVTISGTATQIDADLIVDRVAMLPMSVMQELSAHGVKVAVGRGSVTDVMTELKGVQPRGWPPGTSWNDVPGLHDPSKKRVVVATEAHAGGRRISTGHGSADLVLHETGHALDHARKSESKSQAFRAAYEKDKARMLLGTYLLQPGDAGLSEAYAESFGSFMVGKNPDGQFEHLLQFWKDQYGEI